MTLQEGPNQVQEVKYVFGLFGTEVPDFSRSRSFPNINVRWVKLTPRLVKSRETKQREEVLRPLRTNFIKSPRLTNIQGGQMAPITV